MKIIKAVLVFAIALFCLSACGGAVEGGGTAPPDTTPPVFIKGDPDGNVTLACSVTASFDDALLASSITPQSFVIKKQGDANPLTANAGTWGLSPSSNTIAIFNPSTALAVGTYDVTLTTDIKNVAGLNLAAQQTFSFITSQVCETGGDTTPPQFLEGFPTGTVQQVCFITARFDELISQSSITPQSFVITNNTTSTSLVAGDGNWELDPNDTTNKTARVVPSVSLVGPFTVTLTSGITDLAGNNLAPGTSWTFTASLPCPP